MTEMSGERTHKKTVLVVTTMSSFLTPMALSTVNVALPTIAGEFLMDAITLSWVATVYILTAAALLVPFGRVADIYGRKKIFIWGTAVFTASSFLLGIAWSAGLLIFFRILQGVGSAMLFGTGIAILSSAFPPGERGRALGINVAAVYLGLSCGPFLGGVLTQHAGWRSIFLFNVPLGMVIIVFSLWKLRTERAGSKGEPFDFVGSFIYCAMLVALMYGFSILPGTAGTFLIAAGIAGICIFVAWELKTGKPILDITLFKTNKVFTFSNIAALIHYSATFAVSFLLSLYLQQIKGLSPQNAGAVLISQPLVQAIFSPMAGRMSDRIEPRVVASTGMSLTAAGLFLLTFLEAGTDTWFIISALALLGFGYALFSSPNTNAIMSSVENRFFGVASSMLGTMRLLGQVFSMGIAMMAFALYIGAVEIVPQHYPMLMKSITTVFTVFGFLCTGGIFASMIRGNLR
ncbi:MAG: MFS transporter [Syntrophorhabdaceae bacterium]|nr:MFS transporter [Syntrophorhabdaceae bacterium]MDD5245265.1 MFS transporter [Syntrophorhabdaceae bacterium]